MPFLDQVRARLAKLAPPGTRLVVAVSGGPDSQALLDLCGRWRGELGWEAVWAVGIDHGLRPAAPDELSLARALAERHDLPFVGVAVAVPRTGNLPAQARRARYQALREIARAERATRLAVAHTRSDQAETVLLHLARGAGARGLRGMPWRRGPLIRPLLDTGRAEVVAYLEARGITFAEDPSNADLRRARPLVRHQVLPLLRHLNPAIELALARQARSFGQDERYLSELAREELTRRVAKNGSLELSGFAALPGAVAARLLRAWAAQHRLPVDATRLRRWLVMLGSGRLRETLAKKTIASEQGRLWCYSSEAGEGIGRELDPNTTVPLTPWPAHLHSRLRPRSSEEPSPPRGEDYSPTAVAFDFDSLHLGIRLRPWRRGDSIRPFGLDGNVKVGDLFTNAKIPRALRASWPLVMHGDEVLWVVGLRRSGAAPVTFRTRQVLSLVVDGALPWPSC